MNNQVKLEDQIKLSQIVGVKTKVVAQNGEKTVLIVALSLLLIIRR